MPRRKKTASDAAEEEAPASKRSRTNLPEIGGCSVHWEWEDDGAKWKAYSEQFQEIITDGYNGGRKPVTFDVAPKVQMKIDFDKMVQKNKKTGWERRIRLAFKNSNDSDYHIWQWEDEHGRWNPYSAPHTMELEEAAAAGESSVSVAACNRGYTINIDTLEQENDATGVKRKVERSKVDIDQPSKEIVAVSKSSASTSKAALTTQESTEEAAPKGRKGAAKGSTGKGKSVGKKATSPEEEGEIKKPTVKTLVMKGAAPVDPECTAKVGTAHVYSKGKAVYDVMLNQTNLSNNNNKYYLMQVLEDDNKKSYSVWYRWGRVGYKGQTTLIPCGPDLDDAIETFTKKFYDKTKNDWANRSKFSKVAGKYDLVKVDYSTESTSKEEKKPQKPENIPDSKLDKKIQALVELICDVKKMEEAVVEMKYDAKKAPLGKLTSAQIKAGYAALKKIDQFIDQNDFSSRLVHACDEFYTRIPHDFGMRVPPVIRSKADVKLKLQLLEALSDIEIAMKIIKESKIDENPVDTHYNSLKCNMQALDRSAPDFKMIEDYLKNTHAATHNQYKMEILEAFDVDKEQESKKFVDKGNRMLLWHGSRLTNWVGILSQGLRIAPPEAPVTGYMFGKGVYFADMSSKSANYCYPSQAKNEGLVLLCEVSLGTCNELLSADYTADQLPPGTHSVFGKGSIAPDPKKNFKMANGCVVPIGKPVNTGVKNPSGYTLNYNEFIVYDLAQIKMKYLLKIKFNFK